jgi:hypothetical protein
VGIGRRRRSLTGRLLGDGTPARDRRRSIDKSTERLHARPPAGCRAGGAAGAAAAKRPPLV